MKYKITKLILFICLFTSLLNAQNEVSEHYYLLFDITGSMVGRGTTPSGLPAEDIWDKAVSLLDKTVKSLNKGDKVSLYLFGENVHPKGEFEIDNSNDVRDLILNKVKEVKANNSFETCTSTYYALNEVFKQYNTSPNVINTTYLFTDGNQTPGCGKFAGKISALDAITKFNNVVENKESDYLYIFKLKPMIVDETIKKNPKVEIIENPYTDLLVVVKPINETMDFNKKALICNQKFSFTGTGVEELLKENIKLNVSELVLSSKSSRNEFVLSPSSFELNKNMQSLTLTSLDDISTLKNEKYSGEVKFLFENNNNDFINIENGNLRIKVKLSPNKSKIVFNNTKPTYSIKYID